MLRSSHQKLGLSSGRLLSVAQRQMHCRREYAAAPWALIEGNDKYWARTKVLAKLVKILSCEMCYEPILCLKRRQGRAVSAPAEADLSSEHTRQNHVLLRYWR